MTTRRRMILGPLALVSIQALGKTTRLSYTESCVLLQKRGYLDQGPIPPLRNRVPQYDDPEPLGLSFFRTRLDHDRLENLTLRRSFFGRSEIVDVSFRHTDLSESNLCWNDFIEVDFSHAILKSADLRASTFVNVRFDHADLTRADLRRSSIEGCSFDNANLRQAVALHRQRSALNLTATQARLVAWTDDAGPEPGGG